MTTNRCHQQQMKSNCPSSSLNILHFQLNCNMICKEGNIEDINFNNSSKSKTPPALVNLLMKPIWKKKGRNLSRLEHFLQHFSNKNYKSSPLDLESHSRSCFPSLEMMNIQKSSHAAFYSQIFVIKKKQISINCKIKTLQHVK